VTFLGDYVLDGGGIACLGLSRRDGERLADLRKPLAVARELARNDCRFLCYVDGNLPYRVREEDRGLLDLLLAEHPERFAIVPAKTAAEDYIFQRAGINEATLVTPVPASEETGYLDRYPWLRDPGRHMLVSERDGLIRCGSLEPAEFLDSTAFDLYDDLFPTLTKP